MKKILFLTSTPTIGGNGDAMIEAAMAESEKLGAEAARIDIRERKINFCRACYGCSDTGVCVQQDDFMEILHLTHEAGAIRQTSITRTLKRRNTEAALQQRAVNPSD